LVGLKDQKVIYILKKSLFFNLKVSSSFSMPWQTGEGYLEIPGAVPSMYTVVFL
jgi:hypothetical protein